MKRANGISLPRLNQGLFRGACLSRRYLTAPILISGGPLKTTVPLTTGKKYTKHFHTCTIRAKDITLDANSLELSFLSNDLLRRANDVSVNSDSAVPTAVKRKQAQKRPRQDKFNYQKYLKSIPEPSLRNEAFDGLDVPLFDLKKALVLESPDNLTLKAENSASLASNQPPSPHNIASWISQTKESLNGGNLLQLQTTLENGVALNYTMTAEEIEHFVDQLASQQHHDLCIYLFKSFISTVPFPEKVSDETIFKAARSAYIAKDFIECALIYRRYSEKMQFPQKLVNSVLRCYYRMSEPIVAMDLLKSIWSTSANTESIISAVRGISRTCYNPGPEIVDLLYAWKQEKGVVATELYVAVLESLLDLNDHARFNEISKMAQKDGHMDRPQLKEVHFQKLLHEKNLARIEAFVAMLQEDYVSTQLTTRPLNRAVSYFSINDDNDGVAMVVGLYAKLGLELTPEVLNALITLIYRKGDPAYLVDYVEDWNQTNVIGTNVTVILIWKGLIKAYQSHSKYITDRFKSMKRQYPELFLGVSRESLLMNKTFKYDNDVRQVNYVTISNFTGSPAYILRKIQVLNSKRRADTSLQVVKDMIERNVRPTAPIFYNLLYGICKQRLSDEFDVALRMMKDAGHTPSTQLEVIFLRTHLESLRRNNSNDTSSTKSRLYSPFNQYSVRMAALSKIKNFVDQHSDNLNLRTATSLGYEYLLWQDYDAAITMFNFLRPNPEDGWSSSNTSTYALAGIVRAYADQGMYNEIYELIKDVCENSQDSRIDLLSFIDVELKRAIKLARKKNHFVMFATKLLDCREMVRKYMFFSNKDRILTDLSKINTLFAEWEKKLVEKRIQSQSSTS